MEIGYLGDVTMLKARIAPDAPLLEVSLSNRDRLDRPPVAVGDAVWLSIEPRAPVLLGDDAA